MIEITNVATEGYLVVSNHNQNQKQNRALGGTSLVCIKMKKKADTMYWYVFLRQIKALANSVHTRRNAIRKAVILKQKRWGCHMLGRDKYPGLCRMGNGITPVMIDIYNSPN